MRLYALLAASLGWFTLFLQLYLILHQAAPGVLPAAAAIISYFSFFTIVTNFMVAFVLTFSFLGSLSSWGTFLSSPTAQTAVAVYITVVGATYSLLLRELWNPQGGQKVADLLLHDGMPVIYVIFWFFFVRKSGLRWQDAIWWLAYPAIYLGYLLVRGAFFGLYPYPFMDVGAIGYPRMLLNAALFLLVFLGLGLLAVAMGRWNGWRAQAGQRGL
jgi:hypothetical protein